MTKKNYDQIRKNKIIKLETDNFKLRIKIIEQLKGDKIRVAKFKAKVRYRKVMGFRARLTKLKIVKIG